jgi:hypothetical protein
MTDSPPPLVKKVSVIPGQLICFLGLLALMFSVILRIEPQLMHSDVLVLLHASAEDIYDVNITYQYYLIGALLIAGLLVDIMGPRIVLVLALGTAMTANYFFSIPSAAIPALWGKIIISHTHPFILISALTLGAYWLQRRHFAFYAGLIFATLLSLPSITKFFPVNIVSIENLHTAMLASNIFGGLIIAAMAFSIMFPVNELHGENFFDDMYSTLRYSKVWGICVVSLLGWIFNTFLLNYGATYLVSVKHLVSENANVTVNIAFSCFAVGAITLGIIADFFNEKCIFITIGYLLAAFCFSLILFGPALSNQDIAILLYLTGFFCGAATITYAKVLDLASTSSAGIAFGLMAAITTLGNSFAGKGLALLLEHYVKDPATASAVTWQIILGIIPCALLFGAILAWNLRFKPIKTNS